VKETLTDELKLFLKEKVFDAEKQSKQGTEEIGSTYALFHH